jgi:hypothetical protein
MKFPLSFGFVAAVSGALLACSSDSGTPRTTVPAGGSAGQTGSAGTSSNAGSGGSSGTGSAGTGSAGPGSGGTNGGANLGPALTINADGTVVDEALGINGSALVVLSPANMASSPVTLTPKAGALCVKGATIALPAMPVQADYTNNWGFELQIDLNRGAVVGGSADAGAADAGGADAGAATGGQQAVLAWDAKAHNVVGFAFKLEGQDPTIGAQAGVPPQMRLQTLPHGGNSSSDTYCNTLTPTSGPTEQVLFSNVFYQCYNTPPGRAVFADPIPAQFTGGIDNLQWQINSASSLAFQVDFCLSDIQPILGN